MFTTPVSDSFFGHLSEALSVRVIRLRRNPDDNLDVRPSLLRVGWGQPLDFAAQQLPRKLLLRSRLGGIEPVLPARGQRPSWVLRTLVLCTEARIICFWWLRFLTRTGGPSLYRQPLRDRHTNPFHVGRPLSWVSPPVLRTIPLRR